MHICLKWMFMRIWKLFVRSKFIWKFAKTRWFVLDKLIR